MPPLLAGQVQHIALHQSFMDSWRQSYINFRLSTLKNEPQSFAACYDCEASVSIEDWKSVLDDKTFHPIVSTYSAESDRQALANGRWIGLIHLHGPLAIDPLKLSPDRIIEQPQKQIELYWLLSRGFLEQDFRGHQINTQRTQFLLQYIREQVVKIFSSHGPLWVRCRILKVTTSPVNPQTKKYNARTGWRKIRDVTYEEFHDLLMKEHAPLNRESCTTCGGSPYKGTRTIFQKVMDVNIGSISHL